MTNEYFYRQLEGAPFAKGLEQKRIIPVCFKTPFTEMASAFTGVNIQPQTESPHDLRAMYRLTLIPFAQELC